VDRRLQAVRAEMDAASEFDHVVVNDDFDRAVAEIDAIIQRERALPGREPTLIP
jgi:guanylate kinase